MSEKLTQTNDQESLVQAVSDLSFQATSINQQLDTLTDHLKSKGKLKPKILNLLLKANNQLIKIENDLSIFSGEKHIDSKDLNMLKDSVAELKSFKKEVLAEASRLGYEVIVNINSTSEYAYLVERIDKEISLAVTEIKKLKEEFVSVSGVDYISKPLRVAEDIVALISRHQESDANLKEKVKRKYLNKLKQMLMFAEEEFTKLEADKAQPANRLYEATADLATLYKQGRIDVFVAGADRKFKAVQQITRDINNVLEYSGISADQIKIFLKDVVKETMILISELNVSRSKENNPDKKAEINQKIQGAYNSLLAAVSNLLNEDNKGLLDDPHIPDNLPIADASVADDPKDLDNSTNDDVQSFDSIVDFVVDSHQSVEPKIDNDNVINQLVVPEPGPGQFGVQMSDAASVKVEGAESTLEIEDLYNRYKNADESVFKVDHSDPNSAFKQFKVVAKQINSVLTHSGVEPKEAGEFMERVDVYYHAQIRDLNSKLGGEMTKPENAKTRAVLEHQIAYRYRKLLDEVAKKILEAESKASAVGVKSLDLGQSSSKEKQEKNITYCRTFDELFDVLDLLGGITDKQNTFYNAEQLKSQIEDMRVKFDNYTKHIAAQLGGSKNLSLENALLYYGDSITDVGGIRAKVKELLRKENGILIKEDEPSAPEPHEASPRKVRPTTIPEQDPLFVPHSFARPTTLPEQGDVKSTTINFSPEAQSLRIELSESRKSYLELENRYNLEIQKYYSANNWKVGRALTAADNFLSDLCGLDPSLPRELRSLKIDLRLERQRYAEALNAALVARGQMKKNKDFDQEDGKTRLAFANRFILEPQKKLLETQEKALTPEAQSRLGRIMGTVAKSSVTKWGIRLSAVALAGVTGGVVAAGVQGTRMLVSAVAGSAAAGVTYKMMEQRVKQAEANLAQTKNEVAEKFSLENLSRDARALDKAQRQIKISQQRQKAAAIAAAVVVGGASGAVAEAAGVGVVEGIAHIPATPAESLTPTEGISESLPGEAYKLDDQFILNEGPNKEYGATAIRNVNLMGGFGDVDLSVEAQEEINNVIRRESAILAIKPNMSEVEFEKYLFTKMTAQLGQENWWIGAQPSGIDLDLSRLDLGEQSVEINTDTKVSHTVPVSVPVDVTAGDVEVTGSNANDFKDTELHTTPEPVNENIYTVQKGDTLSDIVNEHFAEELKNAPPGQYNQVLYQVLDNIEKSADLKGSLGIKSDDIDLIYPDEKLDLTAVGEELKKVLAERQAVVDGSDLEDVPNTEPPATAPETSGNHEISPPTVVSSVDGQYFNQPDWKEYINQRFGSEANFNKVLNAEIAEIDNVQPGWLGSLFGGEDYTSPYKVLESMTIADLTELSKGPDFSERTFCEANNLKYETYRDWQDWVAILKDQYQGQYSNDTTWADLFKRHVAEVLPPNFKNVNS